MEILPIKTRKIRANDDLVELILKSARLRNGDILAIVSKVVSLTEGRLVQLQISHPPGTSPRGGNSALKRYGKYAPDPALDALIRKEADKLFSGEMYLAIKDGIIAPSAGIDTSNVPEGHAILWPKNAYKSAEKIRRALLAKTKFKKLGVLVFDSFILPLRRGSTGIALGYAGFQGVKDERKKDLFGKKLKVSFTNIADNLAAAATLMCGEGNESQPFVLIRNATVGFTDKKIRRIEIQMPPNQCLFKALYRAKEVY